MANRVTILDHRGSPIKLNGKPRAEVVAALAATRARQQRQRQIAGNYDAAQTTTEFENYWANADAYDADSANSRAVRETLVKRSRYEIANNGYADGIASTWTTDLVGKGPALRMQTGSEGFNRMVENAWHFWTKAIGFRRKLWCLAHALHSDGEGLGVIRRNPRLNNPIKMDLRLYETEHCQTPLLAWNEPGYIDGIKFDELGNAVWYDILKQHPGSTEYHQDYLTPERVPARFVLHWFKLRRPGQHRGIPQSTSTLNTGAAARRWREAILAAAETAADFTVLLKTLFPPDTEDLDSTFPFDQQSIQKRMMVTLPNNLDAVQMKAEHPNSTFEAFHKALINEQARPKSMPYNKAACDSSSYNYASGRLDHQTYYAALDVDRDDCSDLVLDPLFDVWFEAAILSYGWLGGNPDAVSPMARAHLWDWPKHRVADVESEANANDKQLKNGSKSLSTIYTECGEDYEDEVLKQAASNGITPEQQRQINLLLNLPQHVIPIAAELLGIAPKPKPAPIPAAPLAEASHINAYGDNQPRDEAGRFGSGGGGAKTGGKSGAPKQQTQTPATKSEIAKASAKRVDKDIQRYAEEGNEPELAKAINGKSLKDNEPVDVVTEIDGKTHGVELKTIVDNKNNKLTMKREAQDRKKQWERKTKGTVHTVVFDDSAVFNANGPGKHDPSQRKIFYRRGYGSFRVNGMHQVTGGPSELKSLMTANKRSLPKGAK